jgi:predicted ester cyclase
MGIPATGKTVRFEEMRVRRIPDGKFSVDRRTNGHPHASYRGR